MARDRTWFFEGNTRVGEAAHPHLLPSMDVNWHAVRASRAAVALYCDLRAMQRRCSCPGLRVFLAFVGDTGR